MTESDTSPILDKNVYTQINNEEIFDKQNKERSSKKEEQGLYSEMSILYRKDKGRLRKCSTLKEARDMTTQH